MKSFSLAEMLFLFYIKSKQPICKNVILHQNFFFPEHFSQLFRTYKKTNSAKLFIWKKNQGIVYDDCIKHYQYTPVT